MILKDYNYSGYNLISNTATFMQLVILLINHRNRKFCHVELTLETHFIVGKEEILHKISDRLKVRK